MLTPWKKSYDQPRQHIKKQRHYFANKGLSSQSYDLSSSHVWMWELDHKESWVPKNWCFWTVVLEKMLGVPQTTRRSNQSILKEISPECSLEGLMLKLKLQNLGHLIRRADLLEKTLLLLPSIFPSIRVFSNESALRMRWSKDWSFSFSIIPSKEIPGLISFRMDWLDLLEIGRAHVGTPVT